MLKIRADGEQARAESKKTSEAIIKDADKAAKESGGKMSSFSDLVDKETKKIKSSTSGALKGFAQDLGLSAEQTAKLSVALPIVGTAIAAVAGAATGAAVGLFALAKNASDYGSAINDASEKTGLGAKTLSSLKYAADISGSSFEEVTKGVKNFTLTVDDAAKGSTKAADSLKHLGISSPKKALDDLDGSLAQVIKKIYDAKPGFEQNSLAADAFGKKLGANLIPTINSTKGNISEFIKEAERLGVTISDKDAKASDEFGDTLDTVKAQLSGVTREFAFGFMPAFTKGMGDVSTFLANNKAQMRDWGEYIGNTLTGTIDYWNRAKAAAGGYYETVARGVGADPNSDASKNTSSYLGKAVKYSLFSPLALTDALADHGAEINKTTSIADLRKGDDTNTKPAVKEIDDWTSKTEKAHKAAKEAAPSFQALLSAMRGGSMSQESHGRKDAVNGRTGAAGLFQVLPSNVKEWTRNTPGVGEMSVEEFKKDASAQIAVYNKYMGGYLRKGLAKSGGNWEEAVRRAATYWYGTKSDTDDFAQTKRFNPKEPSRGEYSASVLAKTKKNLKLKSLTGDDFDEFEDQKKVNEQIVQAREKQDARILDLDKNAGAERKATLDQILANKLISEKDYADQVAQIGIDALEKEKQVLTERQQMAELSPEQRQDLEQQIADITSEIKVKSTEKSTEAIKNETAALERQKQITQEIADLREQILQADYERYDANKEVERLNLESQLDNSYGKDRLDALVVLHSFDKDQIKEKYRRINESLDKQQDKEIKDLEKRAETDLELFKHVEEEKQAIRDRYKIQKDTVNTQQTGENNALDNSADRDKINAVKQNSSLVSIFGGLAGGGVEETDATGKVKTQAEYMKGVYDDLKQSSNAAVGSMIGGLADLAKQWVLTGKFSVKAAAQMVAGILLSLAIEDGVKALHELAEGLAMAANPITAPLALGHFAAAQAYGIAAAETGAGGVAVGLLSRGGSGGNQKSGAVTSAAAGGSGNSSGSSGSSGGQGDYYSSNGDKVMERTDDRLGRIEDALSNLKNLKVENTLKATIEIDGGRVADVIMQRAKDGHPINDYWRKLNGDAY